MLAEPDIATTMSSGRGEKRPETKEKCVNEEKGDDEIAEASDHTCPTF